MSFLCGLAGALLGAIVGVVAMFLAVASQSDGNDLEDGFVLMGLAPLGLVVGAIVGILLALKLRRYVRESRYIESAKRKAAVILVGSLLSVPILITAMTWGQQQFRKPPPDQQLLRNFDSHRATFDKLAQMTQVDKHLARVDYNWTDPSNPQAAGVSHSRVSIYRHLLDSIHCHRGFDAYRNHGTKFHYWGHGSAVSDDEDKGYAYLTAPPKEALSTLDDCRPDEKNEVQAYRHIEGCWYLYYDYLPG